MARRKCDITIALHLTLDRYTGRGFDVAWQLRAAPDSDHRSTFTDIAIAIGF
jgi:hypothetical protein